MTPVTPIASLAASGIGSTATQAGSPGAAGLQPFAGLITETLGEVRQLEQQAHATTAQLLTGTGVDVHQAMIAAEKATLAFEMVLSVRNKAVQAYQQVMNMQF